VTNIRRDGRYVLDDIVEDAHDLVFNAVRKFWRNVVLCALRVKQGASLEVAERCQRPHLRGLTWVGGRGRNFDQRILAPRPATARAHRRDVKHKRPDAHASSGGALLGRRHWRLVGRRCCAAVRVWARQPLHLSATSAFYIRFWRELGSSSDSANAHARRARSHLGDDVAQNRLSPRPRLWRLPNVRPR
jgi:hypothetical protein